MGELESETHVPALRRPRANLWRDLAPRLSLVGFFAALVVGFSIASPHEFPTAATVQAILSQQAVPGLVALAAAVVLIVGEFDISIGGTLGVTAVFSAWAFQQHWSLAEILLAAVAIGVAVAIVNSVLVVGLGVNSFIATLAISTVLGGVSLLVTGGETLYQGIPASFTSLANNVAGVSLLAVYCVGVGLLLWYLTDQTPFGRRLRATGSGRDAARLIGVRTHRYVIAAFVLAGVVAALAGILDTASADSATPTVGPGFVLPAYAAAFLGATTSRPARFNVWGTLLAVLVLSVGISGLTMIGAPFWVPDVFNGLALAGALVFSRLASREGQ